MNLGSGQNETQWRQPGRGKMAAAGTGSDGDGLNDEVDGGGLDKSR
jgi:hypothetical protein